MAVPTFTAGDVLAAADLTDLAGRAVVNSDSSIGIAAPGFTDSGSFALTALGGKLIELRLAIINGSAITATGGDTTDTTIFTVDSAYRPASQRPIAFSSAKVGAFGVVNTDGTVVLRAATDTIPVSQLLEGQVMFFNSAGS